MESSPNSFEILSHLDSLEDSFLSALQNIRTIKAEVQKQSNGKSTLDPLLEAEEVAKLLGLDVRNVYRLANSKKIPAIKLGKYWKFSPSRLKKWLDRKNSA